MQVRKVVAGSIMMGALGAASLGMAGGASATPTDWGHKHQQPTSFQAQKTVVKNNGQVGNGNVSQSAAGNAGQINNNQIGVPVQVGAQVPVNLGLSALNGKKSDSKSEQEAKFSQDATANYAENYSQVNNANGNGNHSSTSIGSQH